MAKKNKTNGEATESPATTNDGTQTITISGLTFSAPAPYVEGHLLTAAEASTLNQTFGENLRNNFSKKVKTAQEAAAKAGTPLDEAAIRAEFDQYAREYTFHGIRRTPAPANPVEKEARKMAREMIVEALRAQDPKFKVSTLAEGHLDNMVTDLLANRPDITDAAQNFVEARKRIASQALNLQPVA